MTRTAVSACPLHCGCAGSRRRRGSTQTYLVPPVDLDEVDADPFLEGRRDIAPDEVGPDRELSMAAIDQDGKPDDPRPTVIGEVGQGSPNGAAGEQDVVNQHDRPIFDIERELGRPDDRVCRELREVVAIERDIERPDPDSSTSGRLDLVCQPMRDDCTPPLDPDKGHAVGHAVARHDLVRETCDRLTDVSGVHDHALVHRSPFVRSIPTSMPWSAGGI